MLHPSIYWELESNIHLRATWLAVVLSHPYQGIYLLMGGPAGGWTSGIFTSADARLYQLSYIEHKSTYCVHVLPCHLCCHQLCKVSVREERRADRGRREGTRKNKSPLWLSWIWWSTHYRPYLHVNPASTRLKQTDRGCCEYYKLISAAMLHPLCLEPYRGRPYTI